MATSGEGEGDKSVRHASRKWRKAGYEVQEEHRRTELERRNSTKYHYLKFIEKQKVERNLKTCQTKLLAAVNAGDEVLEAELKKELKKSIADHEYIEHYPRHLPYNALFPKDDSVASERRRREIRQLIREALGQEATVVDDVALEKYEPRIQTGQATVSKKDRQKAQAKQKAQSDPNKPKSAKDLRMEQRRKAMADASNDGAPVTAKTVKAADGDAAGAKATNQQKRAGATDSSAEVPAKKAKKAKKAKPEADAAGEDAPEIKEAKEIDGDAAGVSAGDSQKKKKAKKAKGIAVKLG